MYKNKKEEWILVNEKLTALNIANLTESDQEKKFSLRKSIESIEKEKKNIEIDIDKLEKILGLTKEKRNDIELTEINLSNYEIEREFESRYREIILTPGSFLRIQGPKGMGKTRFLRRILYKISSGQSNPKIVILDWRHHFDSTISSSYYNFAKHFCLAINNELRLDPEINIDWDQGSGNQNIIEYFSKNVFPNIDTQLILVLEEMDMVFASPQIADFSFFLRGLNSKSHFDKNWRKLSVVILYSALMDLEPYSPLGNVGEMVSIKEFTDEEVIKLCQKYELSLTNEQINQIMELLEGHPLLTNTTFKIIKDKRRTLEKILETATTQEGIYSNHLLSLWSILKSNPTLAKDFQKVVFGADPIPLSPESLFQLDRLGLVKIKDNCAIPRFNLYREYFTAHFKRANDI